MRKTNSPSKEKRQENYDPLNMAGGKLKIKVKGRTLNTGRTHFKKRHIPWNKGLTKETSKILKNQGKKHSKIWRLLA